MRSSPKDAPAITKTSKKHVTQQSVDAAIWSICDIMRRGNVASALQYVPELTWILFLRILDETEDREEQEADAVGASYSWSFGTNAQCRYGCSHRPPYPPPVVIPTLKFG